MTKSRNRTKAYGLAGICLISIVSIVYLARTTVPKSAVNAQPTAPTVTHASDVKTEPDALGPEADKHAEMLLARLQKTPDDALLLAETGKYYYQMRRFSEAAKYYEDSVRVRPDAVVLIKLGGAYHHDGDDEKAISAWNHALRLDPDNPDALFNIGFVKWHAQSNPQAAIAAWQQLLRTNPNHPKRAQVEGLIAQAMLDLKTTKTK